MRAQRAGGAALIAAVVLLGAAMAGAEDPQPSPPPSPPASPPPSPAPTTSVWANLPIHLYGSVNLRQDYQRPQDKLDTLLDPNRVDGLVTRLRFGLEFKNAKATVSGGLRFSAGEQPNPTSPFVRLGDLFRPVPFGFDQFNVDIRPLKNKERLYFSLGKIPMPFWRGDKGSVRAEMTWDDDVSPVGGVLGFNLYQNDDKTVSFDNVGGGFIVNWFREDRFAGFVGDTWLYADQVKLKVHRVTVAGSFYDYENLNSGARSPSSIPGSSFSLLPGTAAFLLRPGPQVTNATLNVGGAGAFLFRSNHFRIIDLLAQASVPVSVPWLGRSELFTMGQYAHNFSVDNQRDGVGVTLGLTGGDYKRNVHPFELWGTWRKVDMDAALGTFADSDLGSGTDVKGFEASVNYRLTRNLLPYFSYFNQKTAPFRTTRFNRWYFGITWDF